MSRFFYGSSSESDEEEDIYARQDELSESEEDSEVESEESDESDESEESDASSEDGKTGANRFLVGSDDESGDSDDEDRGHIVKSAKDKRLEDLESTAKSIENALKIQDWTVVSTDFDKLNQQVAKIMQFQPVPKVYVKAIADLDDAVNEATTKQKAATKKMNASNAKAFNIIKQRLKKNNREYVSEIEKYRADEDGYMESEKEEVAAAPAEKPARPAERPVVEDTEGFETVGRARKTTQYTPETVLTHLRSVIESRGKKNTDEAEQIKTLQKLLEAANTPYLTVRVLLVLISTRFDLTSAPASMSTEQWSQAQKELHDLLTVLEANRWLLITEYAEEWLDDEQQPKVAPGGVLRVPGSVVSFVERLSEELSHSLLQIDPHTSEYIERLSDEQLLYNSLVRVSSYVENLLKIDPSSMRQENANRITIRRLEHIYFKPAQVIDIHEQAMWKALPEAIDSAITPRAKHTDAKTLVQNLCTYLFEHNDGILRARALLCLVYFTALHDDYYRARNLMLMSHLTENITNFDASTQVLFNRALVQVGLCAFRAGLIYEAQNILSEICSSGRQKELLAQGQRYTQSPEQELLSRSRQLPFHMHVNLELLECIYLTCSMFLEVPLMAQTSSSATEKRRTISKTFRRMLDYSERQVFNGPPENTRDGVIMSARLLAAGDWKKASEVLNSIKIWDLMVQSKEIKAMLTQNLQEEGLRTYLFTYAPFYDTLSIAALTDMFSLPSKKVVSIASRMIAHEEVAAALDLVQNVLVFRKGVELSRLQSQIVTLADKSVSLLESNEKTVEQRAQGQADQGGRDTRGNRHQGYGHSGRSLMINRGDRSRAH